MYRRFKDPCCLLHQGDKCKSVKHRLIAHIQAGRLENFGLLIQFQTQVSKLDFVFCGEIFGSRNVRTSLKTETRKLGRHKRGLVELRASSLWEITSAVKDERSKGCRRSHVCMSQLWLKMVMHNDLVNFPDIPHENSFLPS